MSDGFARVSLIDARAPQSAFMPMFAAAGSDRPRVAPASESEADIFRRGMAEGRHLAAEAFATERQALLALLAAAQALQPEPSEELAAMIATTVERLVTQIVGLMPVDRSWLLHRIERAVACVGAADAARTLWLHPDDVALIDAAALPIDVCADETLERGALRIDCSHGWVEDSRSQHLDLLRAALNVESQP